MRGTLHLVAAREYPLYFSAFSLYKHFRANSWLKYHGITMAELDTLLAGLPEILTDQRMTRQQLADAIAAKMNAPHLRDMLLSGWGMLLKPASFQGLLCYGPNEGQNVTFVSPEKWLGGWSRLKPEDAWMEIARRFLRVYGPATQDEMSRWYGVPPAQVKKTFKALGDELIQVDVEGWKASALASAITSALDQPAHGAQTVCLLPHFDPYTVAVAKHASYLMPKAKLPQVYRSQGWIVPVALANGRIVGTWEQETRGKRLSLKFQMFGTPEGWVKTGIEAEAERLANFGNFQLQALDMQ
jgi:hypothetical protein